MSTTTSPTTALISARVWEIWSPPPINSFKGSVVPKLFHRRGRRRKVSIEVHRVNPSLDEHDKNKKKALNKKKTFSYEECIVRILEPTTTDERKQAEKRAKLGVVAATNHESDDDESTVAPVEFMDTRLEGYASPDFDENWQTKYRFPLKALSIKGTNRSNGVIVEIKLGKRTQIRELIFGKPEDAENFQQIVQAELIRENERAEIKLKHVLGGDPIPTGDLTFLIEIVSAWDIPAGDLFSSDPYVVCIMDGKAVHKTKYISKTLDPIWTIKKDSLFLLTVHSKDFFLSEGLLCLLKDYDKVGSNETLGCVIISAKKLYRARGERMEFKLGPPPGQTKEPTGYLAVRCRRATEDDIAFMKECKESEKQSNLLAFKEKVDEATQSVGGVGNITSYFSKQNRMIRDGKKEIKQYKVRPGPDPKRVDQTTWMTKEEIEEASRQESLHWYDIGSGDLGRAFVEIIGCDGLPNLDSGGRNKTDAFVALVYEDSTINTDIVSDCLSPRWMPWTKRAFIFHIYHSSSQLFLGIFDYDESLNPADDHDIVGRVSVDLSNLRRDTIYTLKYNIYTTAKMSNRKQKGTITIRLRIEIFDERKMLLSALEPPPAMYVNAKRRKDFRIVRTTTNGKYDMSKYNMANINSYIEELLTIQHLFFYLSDAFLCLLLWRGTYPISVSGKQIKLPVHSLSAFLLAVLVVERPQLVPSALLALIAWVLLAVMDYRRNLPDPWNRCKSYGEFFEILAFGKSSVRPASIGAFENQSEAQEFRDRWQKRIAKSEEAAERAYEESLEAQREYEKEMEEIGEADTDISTKARAGFSIDPFKPILFPLQQSLATVVRYLRHIRYVMFWEECYISFWVVTGCLLLSVIFLFVPWFFLLTWGARVTVWSLFGPWMKLVDILYVQKIKPPTESEREERKIKKREKHHSMMSEAVADARIKREKAAKLKAFKKYMFGKYITRVPCLKEDRFRDMPLEDSFAVPYFPERKPLSELAMEEAGYKSTRLPGQHLVGDMIPKIETRAFTEAPVGQATAHPGLVDVNSPGGRQSAGNDTTLTAYIKIGSLVSAAAVITWFVVPLLSALTNHTIYWITSKS